MIETMTETEARARLEAMPVDEAVADSAIAALEAEWEAARTESELRKAAIFDAMRLQRTARTQPEHQHALEVERGAHAAYRQAADIEERMIVRLNAARLRRDTLRRERELVEQVVPPVIALDLVGLHRATEEAAQLLQAGAENEAPAVRTLSQRFAGILAKIRPGGAAGKSFGAESSRAVETYLELEARGREYRAAARRLRVAIDQAGDTIPEPHLRREVRATFRNLADPFANA